jgi:hypothetical protein
MKNTLIVALFLQNLIFAQIQVGSTILQEREVVGGLDVPWEIKWGPDSNETNEFLWVT